jgi:hypothetical protein
MGWPEAFFYSVMALAVTAGFLGFFYIVTQD